MVKDFSKLSLYYGKGSYQSVYNKVKGFSVYSPLYVVESYGQRVMKREYRTPHR